MACMALRWDLRFNAQPHHPVALFHPFVTARPDLTIPTCVEEKEGQVLLLIIRIREAVLRLVVACLRRT